jgi:HlyD family secretion protein/adhesin transport system membrane fusion protein
MATAASKFEQLFTARADDLILAMELEETRPPATASRLIAALAILVAAAILWSALTPVEEVARSRGAVVPAGDVVAVQHLEGGQVAEILVEDGDVVAAGQPLIRMSPASAQARVDQLAAQRDALSLSLARERAIAGRGGFSGDGADPALAREQTALLAAEEASTGAQRDVLDAQVGETTARIAALERQIAEAREAARLAVEERLAQEQYLQDGVGTRDRLVRAREAAADATQRLVGFEAELSVAREQLAVATLRRGEFDAIAQTDRLRSAADILADLTMVEAELRDAQDRMDRLVVAAPIAGVVTDLQIKAVNSVIGAGAPILQIVPVGDRMVVETQVDPRDIGRIETGQTVSVRVDAFDFATFGALEGVVERISPTTFAAENGQAFYRVRVALDQPYFGQPGDGLAVTPGMTVEADIKAGDRSLLAYLMRPITRGWARSFNER